VDEGAETCAIGFEVTPQVDDKWEQWLRRLTFEPAGAQELGISSSGRPMQFHPLLSSSHVRHMLLRLYHGTGETFTLPSLGVGMCVYAWDRVYDL